MLRKTINLFLSAILIFSIFFNIIPVGQVEAALPNTGAPTGFELSQEITGLFLPTTASFAPDGRVFIAQKNGVVRVYKNGALLPTPFYTIANVNNYVDRGLLGMVLHPDFTANPYVYLLFTYDNNPSNPAGPKTGRLIRVTANGDTALAGSEVVLLGTNVGNSVQTSCDDFAVTSDCLPADSLSHAPGSVRFSLDGKLLVSVGDGAGYDDVDLKALRALNLDSLAGKILRINPDGTAPADNPYFNGDSSANRSKVWASGIRNSFRINVRPVSGQIYLGEVGWNTWEEINYVPKGANLGWPCWEGNEQQNGDGQPSHGKYKNLAECQAFYASNPSNLKFPLYTYPHPPSSSVIGGVFYNGSSYPLQYQDVYFFADYSKNQIYNLKVDASGNLIPGSFSTFASNVGGPVEFFKGPNGDIYYVAINTGSINKISYVSGNLPPVAVANSDKTSGASPLTVNFNSSGSFDPENEALSFNWDFADGSTSTAPNPMHTFTTDGQYDVVLIVTDTNNNSSTANLAINVGQFAPIVTVTSPTSFQTFDVGQTVNFSATATDTEDGTLTGSAVSWNVIVHHCPLSDCHNHFLLTADGNSGSFVFPLHDKPFYIELVATATDSSGLSSTESVSIYPTGETISHSTLFDGLNDYGEVGNNTGLFNQTITVESWVKSLATDSYGGEIVSAGNNWGLRLLPDGNLRFFFNSSSGWKNYETAGINIKDGVWHYVAASKSSGQVKLYVDGVLRATFARPETIGYLYGQKLTIGKHGDLDDNFAFNGSIDEVRLWNTARSDSDISANYNKNISAQTGLIAYFKMEEGTGETVVDSSTNSHSLTLNNGVDWTVGVPLSSEQPTTANKAVNYSSGSFANVTNTSDLKLSQFSVETWVKISGVGLYGGEIISLGNNWGLRVNWDGNIRFFTRNASSWTDLQTTGVNVLDNTWHHIAVVRSASQTIIYVDGVARLTVATSGSVVYNLGNDLVIGKHGDGDINFNLVGAVDEVRFWNSARGASEIISFKDSEVSVSSAGLLAYLKSNEGVGLTLADATGKGHTASLSSGTVWVDGAPLLGGTVPTTNNSVGLDGIDDQVLASSLASYRTSVFTIETWVNASAVGLYGGEIVSLGNNWGLRILPDGNLRFFFHTGGFVWTDLQTSGLNLIGSGWRHIAVVKDSSAVSIYLDGALQSSFTNNQAISYTLGANLVMGRHGDLDNRFNLTGQVDELRIWNVAKSSIDISTNYNKELSAQAGLVGYWKFNENTGILVQDSSGNGNTAALQNGTTWQSGFPKVP
jgi:glucose/arabinose dehydrogenase